LPLDNTVAAKAAGRGPEETAIHTSTVGLIDGSIGISAGDRDIPGYFARPDGAADLPVVIVLSEAFGLHEHIRDITRRFAHEGYFAVAPDLMVRQGDPASFDDIGELVHKLLLEIPDRQVMADIDATVAWAATQQANVNQLAVTGFCWGGRWTWLYAAHRACSAAVAWYGFVDGVASGVFPAGTSKFPAQPIDLVKDLRTAVLGFQGGRDEAIAMSTIKSMQNALKDGSASAQGSEFIVYPEAHRAFFADYRDTYDAVAGPDAWRHCLNWISARTKD